MKTKTIANIILSTILFFSLSPASILAQSPVGDEGLIPKLQEQIRQLRAQIELLKSQLESSKKEIEVAKAELTLSRTLSRGATGDDVKKLQEFLKGKYPGYYSGPVTGYFGPLTEMAVKKLQEKEGIETVGVVGPKTVARLNELMSGGAGKSGLVPPGLIVAPGVEKKQELLVPPSAPVPSSPTTTTATTAALATTTTVAATETTAASGAGGGTAITVTTPSSTVNAAAASSQTTTSTSTSATTSTSSSITAATSTATTSTTTTQYSAPIVSSVVVSAITQTSATISWTTDVPADTQVYYGVTTSYGSLESPDSSLSTAHVVNLRNLTAATTYHFVARSTNSGGHMTVSEGQSFTTAGTVSGGPGNSSLSAQRIFIGQYNNTSYSLVLSDPEGLSSFLVTCAGGNACSAFGSSSNFIWGGSPKYGTPPCPTSITTTTTLSPSDFPIEGWVIDCKDEGTKYTISASMPPLPSSGTTTAFALPRLNLLASALASLSNTLEELFTLLK